MIAAFIESRFGKIRISRLQIFLSLFLMAYLPFVYIKQYKKDLYAEKIPAFVAVDNGTKQIASNVEVGLHINNFHTFSFEKNEFVIDAIVWFKFPVGAESIQTVERFDFQNGHIIEKSKPIIKMINEEVIISYHLTAEFQTIIDYKYFPVGDHRLSIVIDNRSITPDELVFTVDKENFVLSNDLFVTKWKPVQKSVYSGYINSRLNEEDSELSINYPIAIFTIDFENQSVRELLALYFPLFVIFLISLFTLLIDVKQAVMRFNIISHSLPIQVLDRIVIDNISPNIGGFTKIDFIYFLFIFLSLVILVFNVYVIMFIQRVEMHVESAAEKKKKIDSITFYNNLLYIILIVALIILVTYNANT